MCGIAGAANTTATYQIDPERVNRMLAMIRHRGPEAAGIHAEPDAVLGHARLSIVDLAGGLQPIPNEDGTVWVICNGEIFNYVELMAELQSRGHQFRTASDSEVIVHLYEEMGPRCVERFIGQFAFAIWDARTDHLHLVRDRLGVRPLFYTEVDGTLLFASEIKALLADPRVSHEFDLVALDQVFTFWSVLPGRTIFHDVQEVPAGCRLEARIGRGVRDVQIHRYWDVDFPADDATRADNRTVDDYAEELRALLVDATRLRLRADVPVGAYLSGGLDSSAIAALVRHYTTNDLETFSISFRNGRFDESAWQNEMVAALGTRHHRIECDDSDIANVFPDVVWHCETPVLRTSPAPMFLLSRMVHEHGLKVVLTGEGADEFWGGYGIFKEAKVRRWWAAQPDSKLRPTLLRRLHGEVAGLESGSHSFLQGFFGPGIENPDDQYFSHQVRWRSTARQKRFFNADVRAQINSTETDAALAALVAKVQPDWHDLSKAQHLEAKIFLSQYLLSSQGDRVAMAHSVEGRFPFLDHRVVEFAATVPSNLKLRGLNEKYLLKRAVGDLLPPAITKRPKQPYRAPISTSFFGPNAPDWVGDMLGGDAVRRSGIFNPAAVEKLAAKCRANGEVGEGDNMALVGILSTQLLAHQFQHDWHTSERERGVPSRPVMVDKSTLDLLVAER